MSNMTSVDDLPTGTVAATIGLDALNELAQKADIDALRFLRDVYARVVTEEYLKNPKSEIIPTVTVLYKAARDYIDAWVEFRQVTS